MTGHCSLFVELIVFKPNPNGPGIHQLPNSSQGDFPLPERRNQHDNLKERMSRRRLECCHPVTLDGVAI
jgi:hypothetical protein